MGKVIRGTFARGVMTGMDPIEVDLRCGAPAGVC